MKNWLLSLVAAITLLATSGNVEAKVREQAKHKASHNDDSCCKSVKKGLKKANKELQKIEELGCKLALEAPTPICQRLIDKAGGRLILYKSGDYCVTEDVVGTIIIAADSVCLDLCCHTLDAAGQASAVIANDHQALKVFDGRIINSSDAGILVTDYSSVELYNLTMSDHALDAIREETSIDLSIHDINFINDNSGERALFFDTCDNITVKACNMSGFLSTIGAIVQFDTCNTASAQDINVTNNTKTAGGSVAEFTAGTAFVSVNASTGVDFVRVKVNNNTFNNNVPIEDPNTHWRTAEAIAFFFSTSCSLHQCETSNNTDIVGSLATVDTEDYILCFLFCQNCIATAHQSNNNSCTQPILYFSPTAVFDSNNIVMDDFQANNNTISQMIVTSTAAKFIGIWVAPYFDGAVDDNVLRNCQANFNVVADAGSGRAFPIIAAVAGIDFSSGGVIEGCQANFNTIGTTDTAQLIVGINIESSSNQSVLNSTANNNTGGETAIGISLFNDTNVTVQNFSANSNSTYGLLIGPFVPLPFGLQGNYSIVDCVFNQNGSSTQDAAGIKIFTLIPGTENILIKGCQIYDTFSGGGDAAGINALNAVNVVIEDTNVFNTTADGSGHGILFDTLTDSKIIRTQLHGNQNSGVELVGANTTVAIIESIAMDNDIGFNFAAGSTASCCLVQDSRAISNKSFGFVHAPSPLTSVFIGNEAHCNGSPTTNATNYAITGGTISLQQMVVGTGLLSEVGPSNAALGAHFTNISVVP